MSAKDRVEEWGVAHHIHLAQGAASMLTQVLYHMQVTAPCSVSNGRPASFWIRISILRFCACINQQLRDRKVAVLASQVEGRYTLQIVRGFEQLFPEGWVGAVEESGCGCDIPLLDRVDECKPDTGVALGGRSCGEHSCLWNAVPRSVEVVTGRTSDQCKGQTERLGRER
jgi:hypothetical protein